MCLNESLFNQQIKKVLTKSYNIYNFISFQQSCQKSFEYGKEAKKTAVEKQVADKKTFKRICFIMTQNGEMI